MIVVVEKGGNSRPYYILNGIGVVGILEMVLVVVYER
jgi:hypothetical protein